MHPSNKLLSDIVAFRTYARYLPTLARRESLEETINRNMTMHLERFPKLSRDIIKAYQKVHELKIMPSMRSLQFSGKAIDANAVRSFNCSFTIVDDARVFGEILFLLLSGTGVGYSVQSHHVGKLPTVQAPQEEGRFVVHDSIQGWAQAVDALFDCYFFRRVRPIFDLSSIRPKGAYLFTTGAKAPGPAPLKHMLATVEGKLKAATGRKLRPLEVHDLICIISDCVLAGGIRRSALISLFDRDDKEMLTCKSGEWWTTHPYRARANNSAVLFRKTVGKEEFEAIFQACEKSGSGEPGFFWTNDVEYGTNPCAEISLRSNQFCNLTSINQTGIKDKKDFLSRVYSATLIGTLQASYTDFPYLRPSWKATSESEALLGVSFTGIADAGSLVTPEWLEEAAKLVLEVNEKYAKRIGIDPAARATAVKPEGSCSAVLGSSSGIHARHAPYYLRRVVINKMDALAQYLSKSIPELVEEDITSASNIIVTIPQASPAGAILRGSESALELFQRALIYNKHWIAPGHRYGPNRHNVSCTISVRPEEWKSLGEAMWRHREHYSGVALLPFDGGSYKQAPFEECTEERYNELNQFVSAIDFKEVKEAEDNTERTHTVACAGNVCEIL